MQTELRDALGALEDLSEEIDDWEIEHDDCFYKDADEELAARVGDVRERLIGCGDDAIAPIEGCLDDLNPYVRTIVTGALGVLGSPGAIEPLIDVLEKHHGELCEYASEVLKGIGTPAITPLIDRITDRLDNPSVDEYGEAIDIIFALGTLSGIEDPRSYDFMVELLDRFDCEGFEWELAHLCGCFCDQHNPEIIPRLAAIAEEFADVSSPPGVTIEANEAVRRLTVDIVVRSEDWRIYGCCFVCKDYNRRSEICKIRGEHESFDHFCMDCEPAREFECNICILKRLLDSQGEGDVSRCDIDNMPPVPVDLTYRLNQEELSGRFRITTDYDKSGLITISDGCIELNFKFDTTSDLDVLKEFLEGVGDYFSGGIRFNVCSAELFDGSYHDVVAESGKLIRGDCDDTIAVYEGDQFELELVLDECAIDMLIPVIDTQRFLLRCDSYTRMDEFEERHDNLASVIRELRAPYKSAEGSDGSDGSEEESAAQKPPCDHEFELLKTHKKYTVYRCTKCGETKKEFN